MPEPNPEQQLSPAALETVRATAGVVADHIVQITSRFYENLFRKYPAMKSVFNMTHQAVGEQQMALGMSVVRYAEALLEPGMASRFEPVARRIAHKHVALGVLPAHYDIVGEELMGAIGEVLGDAVTDEVAAAWLEVYTKFANRLIVAEKQLYADAGTQPEHPWRRYRVEERVEESRRGFSLLIRPVVGSAPQFHPGQYVSVLVQLDEAYSQPRQYSISGVRGENLRITVARSQGGDQVPDGLVSTWLDLHAHEGTELDVSQPAGDVVVDLEDDSPLVLISAGSGVAPVVGVLEAVAHQQPHRVVRLFHADRDPESRMLRASVVDASRLLPNFAERSWYEAGAELDPATQQQSCAQPGVMNLDDEGVEIPPAAAVFMCGPRDFMETMRESLVRRGVPAGRISCELFGSDIYASLQGEPVNR